MTPALLAIDVGGSTSRAYLVDPSGRCLGHGRNRGGNPASNSPLEAADAIVAAVEAAIADAGGGPFAIAVAQIGLAGPRAHVAVDRLDAAFRRLGLTGPLLFAGDLLAMFASATIAPDGYCVVAGTGAGAVRIRGGAIERAVDATGWLLGDFGSGFWLGHEAARAVVADLDGRGEATALTPAILEAIGIAWSEERTASGRSAPLGALTDAIYAMRPIELARFAPLVVGRPEDKVAARLIAEAERHLAADFAIAYDPLLPGPVALGGSVIAHLPGLRPAIAATIAAAGHEPDIRLVAEGSVGAIVLAMRATGIAVDQPLFERIAASVAERAAARIPAAP